MSRTAVEHLLDRWANEPAFRDEMRVDPEGAVRRAGVELEAHEWDALRSVDWSASDQELQARVSRGS